MTNSRATVLQPGRNCWRIEQAQRAALLVDGAAYFAAFRAAAMAATRTIFIVAWDINSRTLIPGDEVEDGLPAELGPFLNELAKRRKQLEIYVLDWDFAMLYATEREFLPSYKLDWRTHRRLHFRLDDQHPLGASHHQKIVVVDDHVAFVGGLDLTIERWDTSEHRPDEPRRKLPSGANYEPFHDLQIMVEGKAARALGELARERWQRATGHKLKPATENSRAPIWPSRVAADFVNVDVAISRTEPRYNRQPQVQEIKQLYLDAIAAAKKWIYLENQYFTSYTIGDALAARLREKDGPDIVLLTRKTGGGWLEENTMVTLRSRLLRQLLEADAYGRLRAYYPDRADLAGQPIRLHSKSMVVDDTLLRVGSANLNNRSMGLDTECDLAIEAQDEQTRQAIKVSLCRLLGEHLGAEPENVLRQLDDKQSLIVAIECLRNGTRTVKPVDTQLPPEVDLLVPSHELIDPEQTVDPEELMDAFVPEEARSPARRRLALLVFFVVALAGLTAAWRWTPMAEWLDRESLSHLGAMIEASPATPVWAVSIFVIAAVAAVPVTLLTLLTVLAMGPVSGFAYSLVGSLLAASLTYWLGGLAGRNAVRRLAGSRINRLSRRLARSGKLAILAVRVIPVAPFTVINLVAGASHIRFRDFLIGTFAGMTPGIFALTIFADRIEATFREPSSVTISLLLVAVVVIVLAGWKLRRWLMRRRDDRSADIGKTG